MPSPFPGMDPYLEDPGLWPDVHHEIMSVARELLNGQLRPKYVVRIEERVYVSGEDDPGRSVIVPDLRIAERLRHTGKPLPSPSAAGVEMAEPETLVTLIDDEIHEARLAVMDTQDHHVITVIEVLSPSNKVPNSEGRRSYQQKRAEVVDSPSHWVEIDLLRSGTPTVPRLAQPYDYVVHVSRAGKRPQGVVWRIFLPQRLPVIRIPLKSEDQDAPLDLQQVLDTAYSRAEYDATINYHQPPAVPLPERYAAWADELLRTKELR